MFLLAVAIDFDKMAKIFFGISVSVASLPESDVKKSTAIMLSAKRTPKGRQLYERLILVT